MADRLSSFSHRLTSDVSSLVHGIHGAGEAIRGTANSTMDGLVTNHESKEGGGRARDDAITKKGVAELQGAEAHFGHGTGHGQGGATTSGLGEHASGHGHGHGHEHSTVATGQYGHGQGTALGKGTMRRDQQQQNHAGAPKQAGAHSGAPASLESNPFPVEDLDSKEGDR
jgi:hypothetical protein